ncbi:AP2-interacting clathrin-endocytosis protein isoform X4 [Chelonia mydas]|uniref:AP2-interacting clathrin-endocytosis protein isoform X5 n=1 Tax=Chelonia mydas TaxID=8469 RepID=UPI0018A20FD4|nr:AP2-interacting clathrin-endocytosis protein isoform X5 [Chelonia mydas]XP_043377301.1 AP2-interacting clathrin-endocytosis protein isoform X4 [Chelonia mydas]
MRVVYSSDKNIREIEEETLRKRVLEPRQTQENESLTSGSLQNTQISGVKCIGSDKRTSVNQHFLEGAIEREVVCSPNTEDEILEANDAEGNVTNPGNSELETASGLGEDLMMLYKKCCCPDINIWIEGNQFQAHRAILCARSSYFAAMLSGSWAESSQEHITLQGINQVEMNVILYFIYGGMLDFPNKADASRILSVADMYGLDGLKEVAIYILKRDYCNFFQKPIPGRQQHVLECLAIAHLMEVENLYAACMKWIGKHFVKCWSERSFASLPTELQNNCLTVMIQSLNHKNAASLLMESDWLLSSLPQVKWSETALALASRLQEECITFIVTNFPHIIESESFHIFLQAQAMSSKPDLLEQVLKAIEKNISIENSCFLLIAVNTLLSSTNVTEMGFTCKIQALRDKLWIFLVQSFYAVRHTESWKLMRPDHQEKIQAAAFDKGDDRRLGKKPVFTSSQLNRRITDSVDIRHTSWKVNSKRDYWGDSFTNQDKMKSDGLGASGHTSSTNRNTANKTSKHDDLKGKDSKKTVSKITKDSKTGEKVASPKARAVIKPKTESNGNAKAESLITKQDSERSSSSGQKNSGSGKGVKNQEGKSSGARPKVLTGSPSVQIKTKPLKKTTGKESPSLVTETGTFSKSANSSTDLQISNEQLDEPKEDKPVDEGKKHTAVKTKSALKMTNGATNKKANELETNITTNSVTKKSTGKGYSEQNQQTVLKNKGNVSGNSTSQKKTKNAPANVAKNEGPQGDSQNSLRSGMFPKQDEEKNMMQNLSQTTLSEKQPSSKKKSIKQSQTSAVKATAKIIGTPKNQTHSKKGETINSKDPKQKIVTGQPISKAQSSTQRHSRSESPVVQKNMHSPEQKSSEQKLEQHTAAAFAIQPHDNNKCSPAKQSKCEKSMIECSRGDLLMASWQPDPRKLLDPLENGEYKVETKPFCTQVRGQNVPKLNISMQNEMESKQVCEDEIEYLVDKNKDDDSTTEFNCYTEPSRNAYSVICKNTGQKLPSSVSEERLKKCKTVCDSAQKYLGYSGNSKVHLRQAIEDCAEQNETLNTEMGINYGEDHFPSFSKVTNASNSEQDERKSSKTHVKGFAKAGQLSDKSALTEYRSATVDSDAASKCFTGQVTEKCSPKDMDTTETPESHENSEIPFVDRWNLSTGVLDPKESPESDTGSATTSSDDIKPRSEDYDAGGSQDDEGSNERGISKCSTMLCHDFLGRSSSDTSTPEELKIYDSSLRIEVKMKKEGSDLFRVNSTSDDEIPRKRSEVWSHQGVLRFNTKENENTTFGSAQFTQEVDQVSSSADETEDERSEAENVTETFPPSDPPTQPFQGIVNLAFEDATENDIESQEFSTTKNFKRSVLLSVDECEELGSDDGDAHAPLQHSIDSPTPSDVFDSVSQEHDGKTYCSRYSLETEDGFLECKQQEKDRRERLDKSEHFFLDLHNTEIKGKDNQGASVTEQNCPEKALSVADSQCSIQEQKVNSKNEEINEIQQCNKLSDNDTKSQERPCHLDLHQRDTNCDMQKNSSAKPVKPCKSQLLTQEGQVRECQQAPTEYTNTDLPAALPAMEHKQLRRHNLAPIKVKVFFKLLESFTRDFIEDILMTPVTMAESGGQEKTRWITTVIMSSALQSHEVSASLQSQHHRVRYSDSVENGSMIFSLSGIAFLLADTQDVFKTGGELFLDRTEKFINIHRNSFLLLSAALHGPKEWDLIFRIQKRFLGSNLRVIPVHNTAEIVKLMLTIAKITCKPQIDNIRYRMLMAKAQIIDQSPVWKMLHKIQLDCI